MIYPFLITSSIIFICYYFKLFNNEIKCCNKNCNKVFNFLNKNDEFENINFCCNMDCVVEAYYQEKTKNKQYVIFED